MEISVIGNSQMKIGKIEENLRDLCISNFGNNKQKSRVLFDQSKIKEKGNYGFRFPLRATQSNVIPVEKTSASPNSISVDGVNLFVGLPVDTVSRDNTLNHERAITAGLKALKLMGVDGVELPVWWGIVEKDAMGKYDWSGYLAIAEMVHKLGLKLRVSLCFHASQEPKIPLPTWVSQFGEADPSIYFTDRLGQQYKECLSLAVDDLPIFDSRSPIEVYQNFCESFKSTFSPFMGSTITGVTIGLGPDGELRYPSCHDSASHNNHSGVGEFQCYDKYMLTYLKQYAEKMGKPMWGLGGPHDVPSYNEPPCAKNFFKDNGGSWETPYGDFFLSWYSNQLISHGNRILSIALTVFGETPLIISGKLPLVHSWYKTQSHPSELTAGFYNTVNRDGYEEVIEVFGKNSCRIILPGLDLSDAREPNGSSPQSLLAQIKDVCRVQGVGISGENLSLSKVTDGFSNIKSNLSEEDPIVDSFTYQRMGADFFSPKHFPMFTAFVRGVNQLDIDVDDMPETRRVAEPVHVKSEVLQVQTA
ncbi:inactive beta-amylase 9-like [Chenopodium quinoa]|uniref:Beta-amylase n=1 Tax=Chenopodium quinoa TaxID=63459 RepID=A0A803LJJ2_CHEQI|nr:inactive beta-amylase 9-like [Chenopodium quinoa]